MMTRRVMRVTALLTLVMLPLALSPASGAVLAYTRTPSTPTPPNDLTTVSYEARLPESGHVRFLRVSPNGMVLFLGLTNGMLERSGDGGQTWQDLPSGQPD